MGLLDSFKAFVHSITTDDHYASYDSPYRNSSSNDTANPEGSISNGSTIRLNNDMNDSQYSLENGSAGFYRPGMKSSQQDLPLQNLVPMASLQFYKRHDGQLRGGKPTGLIMGLVLLDLEAIIEEKMLWTKVAQRLETQYYMAQHQQRQQNIVKEGSSSGNTNGPINNSFVATKDPSHPTQSSHTTTTKAGLQEFIFGFVTDLEQGNFQIDSSEYQEQLGYLSNDRNGDFMIGDEDEDQGELNYWDKDGQEFGKNVVRGRLNYIEVLKRRALKTSADTAKEDAKEEEEAPAEAKKDEEVKEDDTKEVTDG
ncbi:KNR4/SMI1 2 [Candida viswanathii]|uniref:KNR4/SMI1 2 n=1 Tax=Candida viswanathii TaxID=5486 RepID=A0A367XPV7_9ASCO|nr:KNR4/SMI1 2 [Candida viswanathii]